MKWIVTFLTAFLVLLYTSVASATTIEVDPFNSARVHITSVPTGTAKLHWAIMDDMNATNIQWPWPDQTYNAGSPYYTPPAGKPVVDLLARDSSGNDLGTWAGRTPTSNSVIAQLDPADSSKVQIVAVPSGTTTLHFAYMSDTSGCPCDYGNVSVPASLPASFTPPASEPVVDVEAWDASGAELGTWFSGSAYPSAGRISTTPAIVPPPDTTPPDTTITSAPSDGTATAASVSFTSSEDGSSFACSLDGASASSCTSPKTYSGLAVGTHTFSVAATDAAGNTDPTPATATWQVTSPPPSSLQVGINSACYGTTGAAEQASFGGVVRFDTGLSSTCFNTLKAAGVKFDILISGGYTTGGVSALNRSTWVSNAVSWYQSHCTTTTCPYFEVLNEPYGTWYWGSNADSQTNANAYADLVKRTYTAFHNAYGSAAPKILASCENESWTSDWCGRWTRSTAYPNALASTDMVTLHPYNGETHVSSANAGDRALITSVQSETGGKPVAVTEVGWESDGDCDSASGLYTESEQASNITSFIDWARSNGGVKLVTYFTYHDFGSNPVCGYGVVRSDGSHKPAYAALQAEASH